jgi:hypothetical protein
MLALILRSAFGLIYFLNFAKIFEKSWEAKNKLKRFKEKNETFTNVFNQQEKK